MKFEIPFDKNIHEEQNKLSFDLAWSKNLKKRRENLILGIILIILGILILIGQNNIGVIFIGMGILSLIFCYRANDYYIKNKKNYFDIINTEAEECLQAVDNEIWEFQEDYFRYKNYKQDSTLKWNAFSSLKKINETIFLDTNIGIRFILSEKEVGSEKFEQIITFLENKIKQ